MSSAEAAIAIVEEFLAAIGDGRYDDAQRHLADDAELVFPGGRRYHTLAGLGAGSRTRYKWVDKHRDLYETSLEGSVVFSIGRLYGENVHGVAFDGVRYVDRFRLRGKSIVEQWVWNDLAETGVLTARSTEELREERRR
jgi:hypothetical protein